MELKRPWPSPFQLGSGLSGEPLLLPGESLRDFEFMRNMIINEVRPENLVERLWDI
jgi:hypothetical protein